ncbi:hypothetical protein EMIT048CA2_140117 [Pseudomonas chlororaphis]
MRAFKPLNLVLADPLHEFNAVIHDVAGLVVVAGGTLLVDVERLEPKLWVRSYSAVVAGVVLAIVVATTANTRQRGIA